MSGMDRLTDEELHPLTMIDGSVGTMARELLAHRRASQAAPAPVAVLEYAHETPGRENEMPRVVSCNWLPDGQYHVYRAPAPSDGTREAVEASHHEDGVLCVSIAGIGEIDVYPDGRAAWRILGQYGNCAALTPAPAQEGDRPAKPVCPICKGHSRFDQCSCHYEVKP